MNRFLLAVTLVASTSAQAQILNMRSLLPKIDLVTEHSKTDKKPIFETPPFSSQEINSCITSLCGPADQNISAYDQPMERMFKPSLGSKNMWKERFQQPLRNLLNEQKQSRIRVATLTEEAIKTYVFIKPDNPALFFLGFSRAIDALQGHTDKIFKRTYTGYQLDEALFKEAMKNHSLRVQIAAKMLANDVFVPLFNDSVNRLPFTSKFAHRMKSKYPALSIIEAQKVDAESIANKAQKVVNKIGPIMSSAIVDVETQAMVARVIKGEEMSALEAERYVEYANSIDLFSDLLEDAKLKILLEAVGDYQSLLGKLRVGTVLSEITAKAKNIDVEKAALEIDSKCASRLSMSLDLNASDLRYKRAKRMLQDVKEASVKVARRFVEGSEAVIGQLVEEKIRKIEFSMPDSNAERVQRIQQSFQAEKKDIKNSEILNNKNAIAELQILAMMAVSKGDDPADLVKESKVLRACGELPVESISDAALSSHGKISVSWFSVAYPEVGVGIVAHEVGHVTSSFMANFERSGYIPKKGFSKVWSCVANRNPFAKGNVPDSNYTTMWAEEDFADLFSSRVMAELESQGYPVSKNMGCALVDDGGDFYSRTNQLQPSESDPHSSGALRVLMIAHDRKAMTPECRPLENWIQSKGRPMTCE